MINYQNIFTSNNNQNRNLFINSFIALNNYTNPNLSNEPQPNICEPDFKPSKP